jgi:hypothetical protein
MPLKESRGMAPPVLHAALFVMAAVLVYIGLTQTGPCSTGYSLLYYAAAAAAASSSIALLPMIKTALVGAGLVILLVILGAATLSGAACTI